MNRTPKWLRLNPMFVAIGAVILIVTSVLINWRPLTLVAFVLSGAALLYVVLPQFYYAIKNGIDDLKKKRK